VGLPDSTADREPRKRARLPDERDFWLLWAIGFACFVVRWLEMLVYAIFVYERSQSALLVAGMAMLRLAPLGLFGAVLGAAADRVERRSGLVLIIAVLLATSCVLAVLTLSGRLEVWHLGVSSFVNGIAWAADNPVRRLMVGEVVGPDRMGMAMSLEVGSANGSRIAGPAAGGLILASVGIVGVFAAGAAIYLGCLLCALAVRHRNRGARVSTPIFAQIREGARFALTDLRLRGVFIVTIVYNLFGWPSSSMIPVFGRDDLNLGPGEVGLLASMDGVGAVLGAIVMTAWSRSPHYPWLYVGGVLGYQLAILLVALTTVPIMAGAALGLVGLANAAFAAMQATLVYALSTPAMRARMLGVLSVCIGVGPLGFFHIGVLADIFGVRSALAMSGIEGLLALALAYRLWRPVFLRPAAVPKGGEP
jgi:MFS family permease